jgi:hypothetical protein
MIRSKWIYRHTPGAAYDVTIFGTTILAAQQVAMVVRGVNGGREAQW